MNYYFFQKGRRKVSDLPSCSQALQSKPVGAAWLDGMRKGKSVQCVPPFGKNNF
ncbi:MAG: hypothetical protein IJ599_00425 [Alphaproteobacteria bacterium]|nr:hypothetical protein [Alphaproteobacteria bacterium]